jgi:hypothetical protein
VLAWHFNLDLAKAEIPVKPLWLPLMSFHSSNNYPAAPTFVDPPLRTHWFFPSLPSLPLLTAYTHINSAPPLVSVSLLGARFLNQRPQDRLASSRASNL